MRLLLHYAVFVCPKGRKPPCRHESDIPCEKKKGKMYMGYAALVAGFDAYFGGELTQALRLFGITDVTIAHDAPRAMQGLSASPDLLITELILPRGDGLCLLENKPDRTCAVAASTIHDPFFYAQAAYLGADDCIARPVSANRLAQRGMEALKRKQTPLPRNRIYTDKSKKQNEFACDARIQKILLSLSLPVTLDGFSYLRYCTLACVKDATLLNALTHRLYPMAAKEFSVSPACVERSMRYAVEHIFEYARIGMLDRFFGSCADPAKGKLSVGAFLAQMVQLVQCEI